MCTVHFQSTVYFSTWSSKYSPKRSVVHIRSRQMWLLECMFALSHNMKLHVGVAFIVIFGIGSFWLYTVPVYVFQCKNVNSGMVIQIPTKFMHRSASLPPRLIDHHNFCKWAWLIKTVGIIIEKSFPANWMLLSSSFRLHFFCASSCIYWVN